MKTKFIDKPAYMLGIGEKTYYHLSGKYKGVSVARTKKGYHAEIPGFKGITVAILAALKPEEITRVVTRGKEDYM